MDFLEYLQENAFNQDGKTLREGWNILSAAMKNLDARAVYKFRVGDSVTFTGRRNRQEKGTVTKVNPKKLHITTDEGIRWAVSASACTKVEAKKIA